MQQSKPQPLGELLGEYLNMEGLITPLNQYRLVEAWPEVVGESVAKQTSKVEIHGQKLFVHLRKPVLRTMLSMQATSLVARLNAAVGTHVISEIIFN